MDRAPGILLNCSPVNESGLILNH